jgi:hypothetical protein
MEAKNQREISPSLVPGNSGGIGPDSDQSVNDRPSIEPDLMGARNEMMALLPRDVAEDLQFRLLTPDSMVIVVNRNFSSFVKNHRHDLFRIAFKHGVTGLRIFYNMFGISREEIRRGMSLTGRRGGKNLRNRDINSSL